MNIHEYQAKELLKPFGVPVPRGGLANSAAEAAAIAREIGGTVVVKAQIHAGGRGKAGGVKLVKSPEEAEKAARELLGKILVTHQTGPQGREVRRLLIEEGLPIARELYLGMVLDRAIGRITVIASTEGGVEIEEVARKSPEKILKEVIDPAVALLQALARALVEKDCSLAEINPLVVTQDGRLIALDAKINVDNNALFRRPEIEALRDLSEEDPKEYEASRLGLSYISLDGNIGCMVNGAGLAMATMDIIKLAGGEPANFLDVGGGATKERVTEAFKILLSDKRVKGVLVNIFGGIMRCDVIAQGVVDAARDLSVTVPLVVRLQGTNVEQGRKILADSGLAITPADTIGDAAEKIVKAVNR
jgi:succinyl-CoA synthetase beta subunit